VKKALTVIIGFVHDFASGGWAATVFAVAYLNANESDHGATELLGELERSFFWIGIACILVVFATGAGRTFTYVDQHYGPVAERQRRRLLVIKHVILVVVFGAGTAWQYAMAFG
jgi:putative copper export protein